MTTAFSNGANSSTNGLKSNNTAKTSLNDLTSDLIEQVRPDRNTHGISDDR